MDRRRLCTQNLKRGQRLSNEELIARGLGEYVGQKFRAFPFYHVSRAIRENAIGNRFWENGPLRRVLLLTQLGHSHPTSLFGKPVVPTCVPIAAMILGDVVVS